MSTPALTVVLDEEGNDIMVLYRHWDGYPEAHGQELKDFLFGRKIVNGIMDDKSKDFNGINCLAASLVAYFKKDIGDFYLYPAGTRDMGEEYIYFIQEKDGEIQLYYMDVNEDYEETRIDLL